LQDVNELLPLLQTYADTLKESVQDISTNAHTGALCNARRTAQSSADTRGQASSGAKLPHSCAQMTMQRRYHCDTSQRLGG
jgi:hypothetical protein